MMKLRHLVMPMTVALTVLATFSLSRTASAESLCDRPEVVEDLPPLPDGCQRERVASSGELSYGIVRSAEFLGRKSWQRQVLDKFGERFQNWDKAICQRTECVAGAVSGTRRCTYSGIPCAPTVKVEDFAYLKEEGSRDRGRDFRGDAGIRDRGRDDYARRRELERGEIQELQQLLNRAGFRVGVDGDFGDQSSAALIQWQRRNGIREDGLASAENLDRLRRGGR